MHDPGDAADRTGGQPTPDSARLAGLTVTVGTGRRVRFASRPGYEPCHDGSAAT